MRVIPAIFVISLLFLDSDPLLARKLTRSDLHTSGFVQKKVSVKKNLSFELITRSCQTMLDDSDEAMSAGTQSYQIDLGISSLKKLTAWTELGGKKIPVESGQIHKGYAATSLHGFSDIEQYSISFPSVRKGAKLCFEVAETQKPSINGYFEMGLYSPFLLTEKGSSVLIESDIKLIDVLRDYEKKWNYRSWTKKGKYYYQVRVPRDYTDGMIFEYFSDYIPLSAPVLVLKSHQKFNSTPFDRLKKDISKRANPSNIPETKWKELKKKIPSHLPLRRKIELVMAFVNDHIRYMGDWRTSDGRFIPRSVEQILKTGYGDCKDFSLMTMTILRKMGIKAEFALVRRGYPEQIFGFKMEESFYFSVNHAIVWIDEEGGFPVDPTNVASIASPLPDIQNREVLILGKNSEVRRTPSYQETPSGVKKFCEVRKRDGGIHYHCKEDYQETEGAELLAKLFRNSTDVNERSILDSVADKYSEYTFHSLPSFWDRQIEPFHIDFEWIQSKSWTETPAGQVISLPEPFKNIMDLKTEPRLTGIRLPLINTEVTKVYKNFRIPHSIGALSCEQKFPQKFLIKAPRAPMQGP